MVYEQEAIKNASTWLLMNAGNLRRTDNPELILDDPYKWQLDVWFSTPILNPPRVGVSGCIGQVYVDAETGKVCAQKR